ncbi:MULTISPECIES: nitroreductase/quinone reductase family protein [Streptosporangium]|uniref:Deazaflavin-dependent oxidoreductase (Nitroreductase family) n=1 Tax=Streptosporangium brasiliense TaxID=47480 RepID=A0ABT9QXN7_9ACTN|nr:nitroreductase/quinone reductase family protein [Streptosporangium brasiliense]MDP9860975.1 deazaflavin-dependent oxidoreductase (nitroreductase family) [Streptosporangium brasiliense]
MSDFNLQVIEEFRANGGKVGGPFEGVSLVLLTTTGARSGRRHTTPAVYLPAGDRIMVFASNAGGPKHPAWYHNLVADARVTVETGAETYEATAVVLHGEERDRFYARQAGLDPAFSAYQAGTDRVIPVVALHRRDAARAGALGEHLVKIHQELRERLAGLRGADPGEDLRTHCLLYCEALRAHHTGEDELGFPRLERQFPELAPALARLREEHVVVARITGEIRALLDGGDVERVQADLDRLAAELEAHFAYEEQQLVAALNELN